MFECFYFGVYREIVVGFPDCILDCIIQYYRFVFGAMFFFAVGLSLKVICVCFVQNYA